MIGISPGVAAGIVQMHGAKGTQWLEILPARIEECVEKWSLDLQEATVAVSGAVIHAHRKSGEAATLKLVVDAVAYESERAALDVFAGLGSVLLIDVAPVVSAMLLERVEPGEPLRMLVEAGRDEAATQAGAKVAQLLLGQPEIVSPTAAFVGIAEEAAAALGRNTSTHGRSGGAIGAATIEKAVIRLELLQASCTRSVLLHGDLHHANILSGERAPWLAIDPKGRLGDPVCELGALIRNPLDLIVKWPDARGKLARRVDQLAEFFGYDGERIAAWAAVLAVVAACWELEDGGTGWADWLRVAELLE